MKTKLCIALLLSFSLRAFAQIPEEALRLSWYHPSGTARNMAIGGAMVSLGGDATTNDINPAGLAFFKTSDFVITPGFRFGRDKGSFRGTNSTAASKSGFQLGTSGFVFGGLGYRSRTAFGLTVNTIANFKQEVFYKGQNDYSSFAEPLADEFASSGLTIDQALNNSNISLQTKLALYNYLVDTAMVNGSTQVIARSEGTSLLNQENLIESTGGITEIALGVGHEINKKVLLGLSLGIPIVKLDRRTYYRESDATNNTSNEFGYMAYDERLSLKGVGVNLKAGVIFRPKEFIRIGIAVHSPSLMTLRETTRSGMAVDLENVPAPIPPTDSVASSVFTNSESTTNKYDLNSPTKIIISGAYVFREVENVTQQKGFITADVEYTNYSWMQFAPPDANTSKDFYRPYNQAIDAIYKSALNVKVGGELKFKIVMLRAGFAYYGNPYKDTHLKGKKMNISGGLGYRNKGIFVDLTYVHRLNKDVNFPYRVNAPRANTFSELKDNGGSLFLTVGFKI
jgi:hypothetical protein